MKRRYCAEKDAQVVDFPCHSCKSITVAAVMPSIIKRGTSAVVMNKCRIPQELEVALYSADGQEKILTLFKGAAPGGPDGLVGITILQWDPASSKDKPLKGAYRMRWTGVDGYREFNVTVTE